MTYTFPKEHPLRLQSFPNDFNGQAKHIIELTREDRKWGEAFMNSARNSLDLQ
jgi:hypothetical protein